MREGLDTDISKCPVHWGRGIFPDGQVHHAVWLCRDAQCSSQELNGCSEKPLVFPMQMVSRSWEQDDFRCNERPLSVQQIVRKIVSDQV